MTKILCSAIWIDDGKKYEHQPKNIAQGIVICGRRHHNCLATIAFAYKDISLIAPLKKDNKIIQGFLTDTDKFLDRKEAFKVAKNAKQIINNNLIGSILTSEDLW